MCVSSPGSVALTDLILFICLFVNLVRTVQDHEHIRDFRCSGVKVRISLQKYDSTEEQNL